MLAYEPSHPERHHHRQPEQVADRETHGQCFQSLSVIGAGAGGSGGTFTAWRFRSSSKLLHACLWSVTAQSLSRNAATDCCCNLCEAASSRFRSIHHPTARATITVNSSKSRIVNFMDGTTMSCRRGGMPKKVCHVHPAHANCGRLRLGG